MRFIDIKIPLGILDSSIHNSKIESELINILYVSTNFIQELATRLNTPISLNLTRLNNLVLDVSDDDK